MKQRTSKQTNIKYHNYTIDNKIIIIILFRKTPDNQMICLTVFKHDACASPAEPQEYIQSLILFTFCLGTGDM